MVSHNSETTIAHAIRSFLVQRYPYKELLVIDGASRDRTIDVVKSFKDPSIVVSSEPDGGIYDAMNKGLARFRGDAVGFLNSDDRYCDENVLADVAASITEFDIVSGDLDFVKDHESARVTRQWRGTPYQPGAFRRGWMPAHPTFYVRRTVAESVGRFDLSYRIAADYDYMLRAYELHKFSSIHLDRVLIHMMAGGKSTASAASFVRSNFESLSSRRKWLGSGLVDYALIAKPLRKLRQFSVGHKRV